MMRCLGLARTYFQMLLIAVLVGCGGGGGSGSRIENPGSFTVTSSIAEVQARIAEFIFVDVEVNGARAQFIVDTGADAFVVSRNFAERVGLEKVGAADITTIAGQSLVDVVRINDFRLGNIAGADIDAAVLELQGLDGIIGLPLFRAVVMAIDYQSGVLTIRDPLETNLAAEVDEIGGSLVSSRNFVLNDVSVNNRNVGPVRIDTGSSGGIRLSQVRGAPLLAEAEQTLNVTSSASNGSVPGDAFIADKVSFGGFALDNQFVVVQNSPLEIGLMGGLVLRQFFIVLDLSREQVLLRRDRAFEYALIQPPSTSLRETGLGLSQFDLPAAF